MPVIKKYVDIYCVQQNSILEISVTRLDDTDILPYLYFSYSSDNWTEQEDWNFEPDVCPVRRVFNRGNCGGQHRTSTLTIPCYGASRLDSTSATFGPDQ